MNVQLGPSFKVKGSVHIGGIMGGAGVFLRMSSCLTPTDIGAICLA